MTEFAARFYTALAWGARLLALTVAWASPMAAAYFLLIGQVFAIAGGVLNELERMPK